MNLSVCVVCSPIHAVCLSWINIVRCISIQLSAKENKCTFRWIQTDWLLGYIDYLEFYISRLPFKGTIADKWGWGGGWGPGNISLASEGMGRAGRWGGDGVLERADNISLHIATLTTPDKWQVFQGTKRQNKEDQYYDCSFMWVWWDLGVIGSPALFFLNVFYMFHCLHSGEGWGCRGGGEGGTSPSSNTSPVTMSKSDYYWYRRCKNKWCMHNK